MPPAAAIRVEMRPRSIYALFKAFPQREADVGKTSSAVYAHGGLGGEKVTGPESWRKS